MPLSQFENLFRRIPSVDQMLEKASALSGRYPREVLTAEVRSLQEEWREHIRENDALPEEEFLSALEKRFAALERPSLRRVINATGVVLHTNLGRAPLHLEGEIAGYSNLEFDLSQGTRGKRDVHVGGLLEKLLGTAAIVLNNNAAATYLILRALAAGREAIVSRGELVEIGESFRIPRIMAEAGVTLREVGATNRTHLRDYEEAINENTALIVRVNPGNFRMEGHTGRPALREICELAQVHGVPVYDDLGSGNLVDLSAAGIEEPLVSESLAAGSSIVSFSGDKLLGGPQAGIVAGRPDLIIRVRRHPMYRTFRVDKLILEAMEKTLRALYLGRRDEIPALRMIFMPLEAIEARARALVDSIDIPELTLQRGRSVIGGGSTPGQSLESALLVLPCVHPERAAARLREPIGDLARQTPVICRIENDALCFDLRTVFPREDEELRAALLALPREWIGRR